MGRRKRRGEPTGRFFAGPGAFLAAAAGWRKARYVATRSSWRGRVRGVLHKPVCRAFVELDFVQAGFELIGSA
jgi:hypothetical protein